MDVDEHTEQVRQRALHLAAEVAETDDSNVTVLLLQLKGIFVLVHREMCRTFQKISILPVMEGFLFCTPSALLPENSSLASYFASKIVAFKTPHPLGNSNDLPWGGYGFFLELYNRWLPH